MKPNVQSSRFIQDDIDEIWEYIAERNQDAADRVVFEIAEKLKMIGRNPLVGTLRSDLIVDLRQFPYGNYNIFYFPIENGVEVYRILHSSRDIVQVFDDAIDDDTKNS